MLRRSENIFVGRASPEWRDEGIGRAVDGVAGIDVGLTATGGSDFVALSKVAVSFAANETVKTVSLVTYSDELIEGVENYSVALYRNVGDTAPGATGWTVAQMLIDSEGQNDWEAAFTVSIPDSILALSDVAQYCPSKYSST